MSAWTDLDRARFLKKFQELWPSSPLGRLRDPNAPIAGDWVAALQFYPATVAVQALSEVWEEQDFPRAPTPKAVQAKASGIWAKLRAMHERQQARETTGPVLTPEDMAADEDFWAPRLNDPDPKLRAAYSRIRKQLGRGHMPMIATREPGED